MLPTGRVVDEIDGINATLIDNGMPCVIMDAADFGITGEESRDVLDADTALKARLEAIRLRAGPLMNLGDVREKSVPKMTLVSAPTDPGAAISTRSFIPHRCHATIGVLAAVTVATAAMMEGSPAHRLARLPTAATGGGVGGGADAEADGGGALSLGVQQPSGITHAALQLDAAGRVAQAGIIRTARKLMQGRVFP